MDEPPQGNFSPALGWIHDVVTEHAPLTTTGGRVWNAARRLVCFLEEMAGELDLHRPGLRVLELGSGLGWLGMTLARNLPQAGMVVMTEQETGGGLDWLRHNVALNAHLPGMAAVRTEPCDWLEYGPQASPNDAKGRDGKAETAGDEAASAATAAVNPVNRVKANVADTETQAQAGSCRRKDDGEDAGTTRAAAVAASCHQPGAAGVELAISAAAAPADGSSAVRHDIAARERCRTHTSDVDGGGAADTPDGPYGAPVVDGSDCRHQGACGGDDGNGGSDSAGPSSGGVRAWLSRRPWDLILGSDLVYNDIGTVYLPRVIRSLARSTTRVLYCHTKHRFDTFDMRFAEELAAVGLTCTEVHEPSVTTPPPSPPPLTELFPEMRIAVYDIRLAAHTTEHAVAVDD